MAAPPSSMPVVISARGPNRGSVTMLDRFDASRMQAIIGRKARPEVTGLYP
jgi:hypothetical protein